MKFYPLLALALPVFAQTIAPVEPALQEIASTKWYQQAAISPNGARVAYVETLPAAGKTAIYTTSGGEARTRITASATKSDCAEQNVAWSPDSKQVAFLSDCAKKDQLELYVAPATGGPAKQVTHLKGLLADPRWSPDGKRIAYLFTENLPQRAGPLDPTPLPSGVIESAVFEQRLTVVDPATAVSKQVSPADMYVYEYDWSPDGSAFAVSAAPGDGDNNWWIAQIYSLPSKGGKLEPVYKPPSNAKSPTRAGRRTASPSSSSAAS